tara:strand:+ start:2699 stop:3538 length:840 start_codon:yes stop_codon:yes gene_type:complete
MSSTIKVNNISNLAGDNSGIDLSTNDQIILKTNNTTAVTVNSSQAVALAGNATVGGTLGVTGITTLGNNLIIPNGGNIGSASDTDAMAIASNGVVTFSQTPVGAGGGSMDLLSTQTASNTTAVVFNNSLITDSYDNYLMMGSRLSPASNAVHPILTYSIDNGSNFNLSVSSMRAYGRLQGLGNSGEQENVGSSKQRIGSSSSSTAVETCHFYIYLQGFRSSTQKNTHGVYTGTHSGGASDGYSWRNGARIVATSPINYVKFGFTTGNFDGVVSLYGIKG